MEEIPLYEPKGSGDHCFLLIEKSGISTPEAVRRLARALGRRDADFGHAGLKDAAGTTRQTLSVMGLTPGEALAIEVAGLRVLEATAHDRKIRPGHLKGNRFRVRLGSIDPSREEAIRKGLSVIALEGMRNSFGVQRFGSGGANPTLGRALLRGDADRFVSVLLGEGSEADSPSTVEARQLAERGDYAGAHRAFPPALVPEKAVVKTLARGAEPEQAVRRVPRRFRQIYISAYQSLLFNRCLEQRGEEIRTLWAGDLAYLHRNGACFLVEDPAAETPRLESFEISVSGPIFGRKMKWPEGKAREMEEQVLADERLGLDDFRVGGGLSQKGARRPLRVPVGEAGLTREEGDLFLRFELPKGSYATTLLAALDLPSG